MVAIWLVKMHCNVIFLLYMLEWFRLFKRFCRSTCFSKYLMELEVDFVHLVGPSTVNHSATFPANYLLGPSCFICELFMKVLSHTFCRAWGGTWNVRVGPPVFKASAALCKLAILFSAFLEIPPQVGHPRFWKVLC